MGDLEKFANQLIAEYVLEVGRLHQHKHLTQVKWDSDGRTQIITAVAKIPLYIENIDLFINTGDKFTARRIPGGDFEVTNFEPCDHES